MEAIGSTTVHGAASVVEYIIELQGQDADRSEIGDRYRWTTYKRGPQLCAITCVWYWIHLCIYEFGKQSLLILYTIISANLLLTKTFRKRIQPRYRTISAELGRIPLSITTRQHFSDGHHSQTVTRCRKRSFLTSNSYLQTPRVIGIYYTSKLLEASRTLCTLRITSHQWRHTFVTVGPFFRLVRGYTKSHVGTK